MTALVDADELFKTRYFAWLYGYILPGVPHVPAGNYTYVCQRMHMKVFKALVPHDSNRVGDAAELRDEFASEKQLDEIGRVDLLLPDATILEVLIALAKRANFMIERTEMQWFLIFLDNLHLAELTDDACVPGIETTIDRRLNRFNDRYYDARGHGGLFPLNSTDKDQRHVELWYQMGAFMTENNMY
jgi:hypothetical protein